MPTLSFPVNNNKIVRIIGSFQLNATQVQINSTGCDIRFSFTGTQLQLQHAAASNVAIDVSIDGGAYTVVSTTNTSSKTLVTVATGLSEGVHTCSLRLNVGNSGGGFKLWTLDGIVVTGDFPAISAFPNHDTTGRQLLFYTDSRLITNTTDSNTTTVAGLASPQLPLTSSANNRNSVMRFRTDGTHVWVSTTAGGCAIYIDGCREEEKVYAIPAGSTTPAIGWHSFSLPNDGAMHEIAVVAPAIHQMMVAGGTGIFASVNAAGYRQCRVALVGDSVTAGDSAVPYTNPTAAFDRLLEEAFVGRAMFYNRGLSGDKVTNYLANGRPRLLLAPGQFDILISYMGINDLSDMISDAARDAKSLEYVAYYTQMLQACPKAVVRQLQVNLVHGGAEINRTRLAQAQSTAIATVQAANPDRSLSFVAADPAWTYGPGSPTAGYTRLGDHPCPSGNTVALGMNHTAIVLSGQPTAGDFITLTVNGVSRTFEFDGIPSIPQVSVIVSIGATIVDTITNLWLAMRSSLGRQNMVAWTKGPNEGYFVGVRNCTAISKSGANVYIYRNTVPGFADMIADLIPAFPTVAAGGVFLPRHMTGGY